MDSLVLSLIAGVVLSMSLIGTGICLLFLSGGMPLRSNSQKTQLYAVQDSDASPGREAA